MSDELTPFVPGGKHLPDNDQWTNRFEIKSSSSNRLYIVAQNIKTGLYACSCMGWKRFRTCKHLKSIKVPTQPRLLGKPKDEDKPKKKVEFTAGYKTYTGGRGDATQWREAFAFRMGLNEARRVVADRSPYGILGLSKDSASWDDIKRAYRKLVMQHHPDHGGDPAMFRSIQGAYEVLEDEWRGRR